MEPIKVRDVMTNLVVTLRPDDPIPQAARELLANRISGCPVVEEGRLVGVVSEADLVAVWSRPPRKVSPLSVGDPLAFLLRGRAPDHIHNTTVADVMTTDVVTVSPDAGVWEAARLIDRFGVRRLPVVDDEDYVIGIVARSDIVRAMALSDEDIENAVRDMIDILGTENFEDLSIDVEDGVVTLDGTADRKSTKRLAVKLTARVVGVLEIRDELGWRIDDTHLGVPPANTDIGPDPKAVGPLVG